MVRESRILFLSTQEGGAKTEYESAKPLAYQLKSKIIHAHAPEDDHALQDGLHSALLENHVIVVEPKGKTKALLDALVDAMAGMDPIARVVPLPKGFSREAMSRFLENELKAYRLQNRDLRKSKEM